MKLIAGLMLSLSSFTVCAQPYSKHDGDALMGPEVLFDAVPRPLGNSVIVEWITSDSPHDLCQRVQGRLSPYQIEACAVYVKSEARCVIITGHRTTLHTLGHEFRHCVQGSWHSEPKEGTYIPSNQPKVKPVDNPKR